MQLVYEIIYHNLDNAVNTKKHGIMMIYTYTALNSIKLNQMYYVGILQNLINHNYLESRM